MFNKNLVRIGMCISIVAFAILVVIGSQVPVMAILPRIAGTAPCCISSPLPPSGIVSVSPLIFNCARFSFSGLAAQTSGYAAVRIWANGVPLVDSYVSGYPSLYIPIGVGVSSPYGFAGEISFPLQPDGTVLVARVYHTWSPIPGGYDGANTVDTTYTCQHGISSFLSFNLHCNSVSYQGIASQFGGYAALRVWIGSVGGTPLVDSFVAGFPASYAPIDASGLFGGGYATFPAQPAGTTLTVRVYRALTNAPNSYDGGRYIDTTQQCTTS